VGSSDNRGEEGEAAGEEQGEVSANIKTTISPVDTGQENATTTATEED
jgi:hypothetical protein